MLIAGAIKENELNNVPKIYYYSTYVDNNTSTEIENSKKERNKESGSAFYKNIVNFF